MIKQTHPFLKIYEAIKNQKCFHRSNFITTAPYISSLKIIQFAAIDL